MKYLSIVLIVFTIFGCKNKVKEKTLTADEIINKSIKVSGGLKFENSQLTFHFRNQKYFAKRNSGKFSLVRSFKENNDSITDFLSNIGFKRMNGGDFVKVEDSIAVKYKASINSVHYFSVLPYGLNDKAVNKTLLDEEKIETKDYYKIKVTFNEEGGGEDYEDVFIYWVSKQTFKLDYLAYSYNEDDGVGMRFREAYNERYVNGLRFVDYNNYKAEDIKIALTDLGKAFDSKELKLLSKIELENLKVDLIDL